MSLAIAVEHGPDAVTLSLTGRLTVGEPSETLRTAVREILAGGQTRLILDLNELGYVDSVGLGELVAALVATRRAGGDLQLAHVPKRVQDLLEVSCLFTVFRLLSMKNSDSGH